jgi:hypothetical protein
VKPKLSPKQAVLLFLGSAGVVLLILFVWGAITAVVLVAGEGTSCEFEVELEEETGPEVTGVEELHWDLVPMKYCVATYQGETVEHVVHPLGALGALVYPLALVAGIATWIVGRRLLLRGASPTATTSGSTEESEG